MRGRGCEFIRHHPTVTIIQQTGSEPPGLLGRFLAEHGIPTRVIQPDQVTCFPRVSSSHLIILGGPMGAHDEAEFPFLADEKALIRQYIHRAWPVLGICLGAQLIAAASGGPVYRFREEVGWYVVRTSGRDVVHGFPGEMPVFQFHHDTFDLPPGAIPLWRGAAVPNQGFALGSALALQFHPEVTAGIIRSWTASCGPDREARIREDTERYLPGSTAACATLIDRFLRARPGDKGSWIVHS